MSQAREHFGMRHVAPGRALARFSEALNLDPSADGIVRDAQIQRFEFCIELCSLTLRAALAVEGLDAGSPRSAVKAA